MARVQDYKDGSHSQVTASAMDTKWRDDFERMKKARVHRYGSETLLRSCFFCHVDVLHFKHKVHVDVSWLSLHGITD